MDTVALTSIKERAYQGLLIVSTLALSWLGMMAVHEFGHVLFAWLSGGTVARVVLHPLVFSRTDMRINPHPLVESCGGVLAGVILPLLLGSLWRFFRWSGWYILQFFAGFCLIANGIYMGVVSFIPHAADPADMMREGVPQWVLVLFGIVTCPLGLWFWNGLGPSFGLGKKWGKVGHITAVATALCFLAVIAIELLMYAG